jgi:hypothetical protein
MRRIVSLFAVRLVSILLGLINDILRFGIGLTKSRAALAAENLSSESNWPSTESERSSPSD